MIRYDEFFLEFCRYPWRPGHTCSHVGECFHLFHSSSSQTARSSLQRNHETRLQPPGGTGGTQNQSNHGNDGDALERGAIAESGLANADRHLRAKKIGRLALVLVGLLRSTGPLYILFTWNRVERLLGADVIIKIQNEI